MNLSSEHYDIGLQVIVVVFKASYRRARCDLFYGGNYSSVQLATTDREKDELWHGIAEKGRYARAGESVQNLPAVVI